MEIGILMGLLGLGLMFGMGGSDDFDTSEAVTDPEKDVVAPETPVNELVYDGSPTLTGTEGDDTLASGQEQSLAPSLIDLRAGDDTAVIETPLTGTGYINVFGGEGDDFIEFSSETPDVEGDAYGGDGDDTLTTSGGNTLFGQDDDDTINILDPQSGFAVAEAGDGDDTLNVVRSIGDTESLSSSIDLFGGPGADTFNVDLITVPFENSDTVSSDADYSASTGISLNDFTPSDDALIIDISSPEGVEVPSLRAALVPSPDDPGYYTLELNFSATNDAPAYTSTMTIASDSPLTLDDIVFVDKIGEVLTVPDDGSDIIGTDGNDTLTWAGDDDSYYRDVGDIRLGDGDDLVDINLYQANIEGGLGNDTITSLGIDQIVSGGDGDDLIETNGLSNVYGDAGNDTLVSSDGENMWGGEGDDVLSLGSYDFYGQSGSANGEAGDDTLYLNADIGHARSNIPTITVNGGEGADDLNFVLNMTDGSGFPDAPQSVATDEDTGFNIEDFDPSEDTIMIQINRSEGHEARAMTSAEIVTEERVSRGEPYTISTIVMEFAATNTHGAHTSTIEFDADVNLSIEDIVFIQN